MKRLPIERPTEHYDARLIPIDEQIVSLLKQRKEISNNNTGVPPKDILSNWATKYEFYEDFLTQLFGAMKYENLFKPRIEPTEFRKYLSMSKSIEINGRLYSVPFIRQYKNASVIQLHTDWDEPNDSTINLINKHHTTTFELFISDQYDCRKDRARGSTGNYTYHFIVSPPLPDNISGLNLVFKEYCDTLSETPTGLEIVMHLE